MEEGAHSKSAVDNELLEGYRGEDEVTEEPLVNIEAGNLQELEGSYLSEQPLPTLAKVTVEVLAQTGE